MFKNIQSYFNKSSEKEIPKMESPKKEKIDISPFITDVEEILQITHPTIHICACIYEAFNPAYGQNMVMSQEKFYRDELPKDAMFHGGYYFDDRDLILLARKSPQVDFYTGNLWFKNMTSAEMLFNHAHELRHKWQKEYAADIYYRRNALHLEVIDDIAEVDADAFAYLYVFSDRTPFTYKDFDGETEEKCMQATLDNGKRWKRIRELSKQYDFNCDKKLGEFKDNADWESVNRKIFIMKQNRLL